MRTRKRILLTTLILLIGLLVTSFGGTRAQAQKLASGYYAGKFHYTIYWIMVDDQTHDDFKSHVEYVNNIDIEGTITFQVDKSGKILPTVSISPGIVSAYEIDTYNVNKIDCNVTSYLSGETNGTIKQSSGGSSSLSFTADVNLVPVRPVYFKTQGPNGDCKEFGTQDLMVDSTNVHITTLNDLKTMQFVVVRNTANAISGSINISGVPQNLTTPGGMIVHKEEGNFVVHLIDPLASLSEQNNVPQGEWRFK